MSMADMIDERLVSFGLDVTNKEDAIRKICKMMYDAGKVSSYEDYLQGVIMLAAPNTADNVHLKMLSSLAVGLMDDDFREALKDATDVDQIIDIFKSKKEE